MVNSFDWGGSLGRRELRKVNSSTKPIAGVLFVSGNSCLGWKCARCLVSKVLANVEVLTVGKVQSSTMTISAEGPGAEAPPGEGPNVLAETASVIDGTSPVTQRRLALMEQAAGVLAL
jgi:hypothetical protein